MLFPAVPLFAAFAALSLESASRRMLMLVAVPSVVCGYLSAQAGVIPDEDLFAYAVKTWVSGTGMGVFFKEALPAWLGLETLHRMVSRPEVTASGLLRLMGTDEGWVLVRNQLAMLGVNMAVLGGIVWFLRKLWRRPGPTSTR
jgi:hypothetical protein